jgi:hypothetical protein
MNADRAFIAIADRLTGLSFATSLSAKRQDLGFNALTDRPQWVAKARRQS